jgi:hypothetical protein
LDPVGGTLPIGGSVLSGFVLSPEGTPVGAVLLAPLELEAVELALPQGSLQGVLSVAAGALSVWAALSLDDGSGVTAALGSASSAQDATRDTTHKGQHLDSALRIMYEA